MRDQRGFQAADNGGERGDDGFVDLELEGLFEVLGSFFFSNFWALMLSQFYFASLSRPNILSYFLGPAFSYILGLTNFILLGCLCNASWLEDRKSVV